MVYSAVDLQVFTNTDGLDVVLGEHKCSPILALLYTRKKVVPKFYLPPLDLLVFEIFTPQLLACIFLAFNQVWINVTSTQFCVGSNVVDRMLMVKRRVSILLYVCQ